MESLKLILEDRRGDSVGSLEFEFSEPETLCVRVQNVQSNESLERIFDFTEIQEGNAAFRQIGGAFSNVREISKVQFPSDYYGSGLGHYRPAALQLGYYDFALFVSGHRSEEVRIEVWAKRDSTREVIHLMGFSNASKVERLGQRILDRLN